MDSFDNLWIVVLEFSNVSDSLFHIIFDFTEDIVDMFSVEWE